MPKQGIPGVMRAVLQKHAQGLGLVLAHPQLQVVAATHAHKGATAAKHPAKQVGPVPSSIKGGDAAAAQAKNHVPVGVGIDCGMALNGGQQLLRHKAGKIARGGIKLVAAVVAQHGAIVAHNHTWLQKHRHRGWHSTTLHQAVDHCSALHSTPSSPKYRQRAAGHRAPWAT